ncbi:MAG: sigma-70 family RNA polymerase sigma factor [Xanthobacteraceae bacterium]
MPPGHKNDPSLPGTPRLTLVASAQPGVRVDWAHLMQRAQAGDRDAYRRLLRSVEPYVRSLARRCFRQPSDIEDAVQDVLLTLHAIRATYDPARPFGPWIAAISQRRIVDRLRRETRRSAREIELTVQHETFAGAAANIDQGREIGLAEAIEKLPPEQRQAIKMLKLNEMSLREAALKSGRSIAALKVATHRGIKSLRKLLGGEAP